MEGKANRASREAAEMKCAFDNFLCSFKPEDGEGQWRYTEKELEKAFIAGGAFVAKNCYQIASSHEFGFGAAKTIRETFGLEI